MPGVLDRRTSRRPQVLFLACHLPFPPISGGRRRELELIKRIARDVDIHLCVASKTYGEDVANAAELRRLCGSVSLFACAPVPLPSEAPPGVPVQVLRHRAPGLGHHVRTLLATGDVDIVHVEGFYLMQHVPDDCAVPVLLVDQNVEYVLWRQRMAAAPGPRERHACLREYTQTLQAETDAWRRADLCAVTTEDDRRILLDAEPRLQVAVVPDGFDHVGPARGLPPADLPRPSGPLMTFVANFAYQPNLDAAEFLCDVILPRIRARRPDTALWLVGNAPPQALQARAERVPGIVVTGRVPDVRPYLSAADVVVCPLRVGGGIKVKVLEALAMRKATVTTSIGIQGLGPAIRDAVIVHDDPLRFAQATISLLDDPRRRRELETSAERFACTLPTWNDASQALIGAYRSLAGRRVDLRAVGRIGTSAPA